jgi:outer membrane protein assembly factor BamB
VRSSPAISADGTIYFGSYDGRVYALTPSKDLLWTFNVEDNKNIESSPSIGNDGTIYIGGVDGRLYAIDGENGKEKWRYYTDGRLVSSPAIGRDGTLYVGSNDSKLYAINPDGTLRWRYLTGNMVRSSPAIGADGTIYVGSDDGKLYALDPLGNLLWTYATGGLISSSPAIGHDGNLYIGSEDGKLYVIGSYGAFFTPAFQNGENEPGEQLIYTTWIYNLTGKDDVFDVSLTETLWPSTFSPGAVITVTHTERVSVTVTVDVPFTALPGDRDTATLHVSARGQSFVSTSTLSSSVPEEIRPWPMFGHDRQRSGRGLFAGPQTPVYRWSFTAGGLAFSSPAIGSDGVTYFGADDGNLYAVNPDGSLKWTYATSDTIRSSPAIGLDGMIYFGSLDHKFYALKPDGTEKWKVLTNGAIGSSPTLGTDGTIYVGSDDGQVYAFDPKGEVLWSYQTLGPIRSSPTLGADDTLYVGSGDGNLYALRSGTLSWTYLTGGAIDSTAAIGADGMTSPMAVPSEMSIYFGSTDGNLYALFPDGTLRWAYPTEGIVDSSPAISGDGTIFISAKSAADDSVTYLYAIQPNGNLYWRYPPPPCVQPVSVVISGLLTNTVDNPSTFAAEVLPATTNIPITYTWQSVEQPTIIHVSDLEDTISYTWNTIGEKAISLTAANQCGATLNDYAINILPPPLKSLYLPLLMRNTPSGSAHEFGIHTFSPTTGNLTPSPIIDADGSIHIVLDNGDLFAFDPDGNILWRYPTGGQGSSTAAIGASGDIYLALDNGNLLSLGLAKPIFARQEQRYWNQAGETVPYTLLLQNLTGPADRYLLSFQDNTWPVTLSVTETEVMLPGEVFTITVEVAIPNDAQTGDEDNVTIVATSEHWPEMTATTTLNSLVELGEGAWPMFHHDPTHSGRSLFTGPLTNTLAWAEPLFFSPGVYASAAIALDGTIYIGGNDGYLHAISPAGTVLWSTYLKGYLQSSPAISRGDGTIYVGSDDGNLYALDPQNGDILWTFQTPERIASSPTISADDLIYFGSDNGKLYALNPDGSFRWS